MSPATVEIDFINKINVCDENASPYVIGRIRAALSFYDRNGCTQMSYPASAQL